MDPLTHFIIWMVCFVIGVPTLIIILICAFSPNPKPEPIIEPIINPLFDETYKVVTILSTKDEIKPEKSNELVKALSYMATQLVLHVFSTPSAIEISIICKSEDVHRLRQTIFGATDSVDIEISPAPEYMPEVTGVTCELTRMGNLEVFPLTRIHDFKETDPLNNILECVTPLEEFQAFSLYIVIRPLNNENEDSLRQRIERFSYNDKPLYNKLIQRFYSEPHFEAKILSSFVSSEKYDLRDKDSNLVSILRERFNAGHGGLISSDWKTHNGVIPQIVNNIDFFMMTSSEVAAIWHPFSNKVTVPGARFLKFPPKRLPDSVTEGSGIVLGLHRQRGENASVFLPLEDLQLGHAVLLGKTRVGKTTLGHQMARAIKKFAPTSSLIIIDPNGDWATDYAKRSVPQNRLNKTYLIDFGDTNFPPSLPILKPPKGISIETFIKTTFETVKLIFGDKWSPRMENVLFNTVAALAYNPGSTLLDIERLYTNPGFRRRILARVPDSVVRDYWNRFDEMSRTEQDQRIDPILTRIGFFTRSVAIRNITCRTDAGFDIAELIEEGADVLISTVGADIHDEADLLVEFLVSRIHLAVISRLGKPGPRNPVFLMIDESQHVKGPSMPVLLSEAAKTGLCVIALTQFMAQWTEDLTNSIQGNVGTVITFQVGPNDSKKLTNILSPFTPAEAENLDKFEALVKMRVDGRTIPTFNINTLPLTGEPDEATYRQVVEQSRARFTKPKEQLMARVPEPFEAAFGPTIEALDED